MNEPFTNYWRAYSPKQEGCHVSPGRMQSALLCETAQAMKNAGLSHVDITASDETNASLQVISCRKLSAEAWECVDRISTHTYSKATPKIAKIAEEHNKPLWMTETDWSSTEGDNAGEMGPALWLSCKIIEDLSTLECSAWVIWQIVAAYISQHEYKGRRDMPALPDLTQGYWGTAFADMDTEKIHLTQKYYAFGQFSRFFRPGMSLIKVDNSTIACYDKNERKLCIVCVNSDKNDCSTDLVLSGFTAPDGNVRAVRTSGCIKSGEHWTELDGNRIVNNILSVSLKGNSVTSFVISNAD